MKMDLRKELIDFYFWHRNNEPRTESNIRQAENYIDMYLKSINRGSNETQAVRQNEQPKEGVVWKCNLCGRDKFTSRQPHKCNGGFRKRGLTWTKITRHQA